MTSELTNAKFKCRGCGAIYHFSTPAHVDSCECGANSWEQIILTVICDFCSVKIGAGDSTWTFPCEDFIALTPPPFPDEIKVGDWCCCEDCKSLVEAADWPALAVRVAENDQGAEGVPPDLILATLGTLWDGFAAHRKGDPIPETPAERDQRLQGGDDA